MPLFQSYMTSPEIDRFLGELERQGVSAYHAGHQFNWDDFQVHHPDLRLRIQHPVVKGDYRRAFLYSVSEGSSNARHLRPLAKEGVDSWSGRGWMKNLAVALSEYHQPEWRGVPGFDNYEVSIDGRVRNGKRKRELKHIVNKGSRAVILMQNNHQQWFSVASLVLEVWGGEPKPKPRNKVRFLDGDDTNLHLSNLEWR